MREQFRYWRQQGLTAQEALGRARMDATSNTARYPTIGSAYQNEPMKDGGRWIENPAAAGLRFLGWSDELGACDHNGWYLDSEFQDETARGCVYQLPARNGRAQYIPAVGMGKKRGKHGWQDKCGSTTGPAILYLSDTFEGEIGGADGDTEDAAKDAARRADHYAERLAEREREYQDAWREGSNAARLKEEANEAKERARTLIRELRTIRDQVTPGTAPALCSTIRASIKDALRTWADNNREASELIDALSHLPAFKEGLAEG